MNRFITMACMASIGCICLTHAARANTIVVDSTADSGSACTLRNAIDNANNNAQTHSGCAAGSGADTITFSPTVFASPQTIILGSSLPDLTDTATTTIDGGNVVTVSGNDIVQIIQAGNLSGYSGSAELRNLELTHGNSSGYGGAILMTGASLLLDHVVISNSTATYGGGGVFTQGGTTTIDGCLFISNLINSGTGGGLMNSTADVNIRNTTFTLNTASSGGAGVFTGYGGTVTVTNSTFSGNSTSYYGSAIRNFKLSALILDYVTVSNNTSTKPGGGGAVDVENDGTVVIANSVVAGNSGHDCNGTLTNNGSNFFGDSTCGVSAQGDPMLDSLAYGDAIAPTMVPLTGSPLIDQATCEAGVTSGQRGVPRPQGPGCDIGAVEVELPIFADGFEVPI